MSKYDTEIAKCTEYYSQQCLSPTQAYFQTFRYPHHKNINKHKYSNKMHVDTVDVTIAIFQIQIVQIV